MKTILRIFNIVIMALSVLATVFLFSGPTLSLYSNISVSVTDLAKLVPETEYTKDIDIVKMLGTDTIHLPLSFTLTPTGTREIMDGNRDTFNNNVIANNIDDISTTLEEPISLITEFTVRGIVKSTIREQIRQQVQDALDAYAIGGDAEDTMEEVGMDDQYFEDFSITLYNTLNSDEATVDTASLVLYDQVEDALAKAESTGMVDTSAYGEDAKQEIRDNFINILNQIGLVNDDGTIIKISLVVYVYLSQFLKEQLSGKVEESELAQKSEESKQDYSRRLMKLMVYTLIPDVFYQILGYVATALYIGLYVFAAIWMFLFVWTLIKTLTSKPWTFFGPLFYLAGILQLVLGLGITILGKFVLPQADLSKLNIFITSVVMAPRSYALLSSIIFVVMVVLAIVYGFFKRRVKKEVKAEKGKEE